MNDILDFPTSGSNAAESACSLSRANSHPGIHDPLRHFSPEYPQHISGTIACRERGPTAERLNLIYPYLTPDAVYLEIGAEDCRLTREVARRVRFAYGVGESARLLPSTALPANADVLSSSQSWIPIGDDRVTVAFSDNLVGRLHPETLTRHLREVKRVLVPGGVYVCRLSRRTGGSPRHSRDAGLRVHRGPSPREMMDRLAEAGFGRVGPRLSCAGRSVPCPVWVPGTLETLLGLVPRPVGRMIRRSAAVRSVLDGVTLVAWKDHLAWIPLPRPTCLGLGVA